MKPEITNEPCTWAGAAAKGKHDGDEFDREAWAYAGFHADRGDRCALIDVPLHLPATSRPAAVEKALLEARGKSVV